MKKIDIICNTSPIIGLISIDRLYLLWDLFGSIIIPEAVFNELCADSVNHQDEIKRIKECVNSGKIIIYKVKNADTVKALYGRLHFGELEVIVGAKELGIDFAIIDEHAARKMASEFLIDTIGVLGILSLAKTKGLINLVKPEMDKLISNGYRISDKIIYVFLTIFLYLLKCPQSLILSALRAFCFCGKPHISRSIFLYFRYQAWLKSW